MSPKQQNGASSRGRRALVWTIGVAAAAVISNFVVPAAHKAFANATCYGKYFWPGSPYAPSNKEWQPYGVTWVRSIRPRSVLIQPAPSQGPNDEWYGAVLPFTRFCDFRLTLRAELIGPRDKKPADVKAYGYGYAIGVHGEAVNDLPSATTVQFDPPFKGLRLIPLPQGPNLSGYNASTKFPKILPGTTHTWAITAQNNTAFVSLDGKGFQALSLTSGHDILIRVWNAKVLISDVKLYALAPAPLP